MGKKTFDIMKNGYNRYQVDDYIQVLDQEIITLNKNLKEIYQVKEELASKVSQLQKKYDKVSHNLAMKENAADEMARIAMKEANVIVETANKNADVIVKEALLMARGILLDLTRLGDETKDRKDSMREDLTKIAQALDEFEPPTVPDIDLLDRKI